MIKHSLELPKGQVGQSRVDGCCFVWCTKSLDICSAYSLRSGRNGEPFYFYQDFELSYENMDWLRVTCLLFCPSQMLWLCFALSHLNHLRGRWN